jgi:hypothetical protein
MKKLTPIHTSYIRFKRWSRKNYSIFCSLKREVNIGVLAKNILDASFKESDNYNFICPDITHSDVFDDDKDQLEFTVEKLYQTDNTTLALADAFSQIENVKYYHTAGNGYN